MNKYWFENFIDFLRIVKQRQDNNFLYFRKYLIANMFQKRFYVIGLTVILLFLLSVLLVHSYKTNIRAGLKERANQELTSVALLKSNEIANWYADELMDASTIANNNNLSECIEAWMFSKDSKSRLKIQEVFYDIIIEHGYNEIFLLTTAGNLVVSGKGSLPGWQEQKVALQSVDLKKVCSSGLFLSEHDQKIYIDFATTVLDNFGSPLYVILFKLDPNQYLFPLIQNWPLPSKTAETLILSRNGDSIVFLNELRHKSGTALNLMIPLSRTDVPAVYAATGNEGIFEGVDYRDENVIAYVKKISGTPWFMVAKVDKNELYSNMRQLSLGFIIILVLIDLLILISVGFIYTYIQRNFFKSQWLSQEQFKTTLYSIGDAVITTDGNGFIKNLNPIAEQLTGWTEIEAVDKPIEQVFKIINEDTFAKVANPVSRVITEGCIVGLSNHTLLIAKNGDKIPIADSGAPIVDNKGNISGVVLVFRNQTDERNYQKTILEQKRQVQTLLSNLPGMAYKCVNDEQWTMEFVSDGSFDLTGYASDEIIQSKTISYGDLLSSDDRELVWGMVQKAIAAHESFEIEYRINSKDGTTKWVWEKGIGIYNSEGECTSIEGFVSDIDQRKAAETLLKKSEEQYHSLARNTSVGIFRTNANGDTIYANPKWHELTGLTIDQTIDFGWLSVVHPDDRQKVKDFWNNAVVNHTDESIEYRFLNPDGKITWVKTQITLEIGDHNEFLGIFGALTDITDKVRTEESLRYTNKLFTTIIDNIPDSIYMKDVDGRKLVVNMANVINTGLKTKEELIGKNDFDIFPPEIAEKFWTDDLQVIQKGEKIINKIEPVVDKQNNIRWLSTSKIPFVNEAGEIVGLVGIGHDITQRKLAEDERMKLLTAVAQSPVSILITDHKGNIQYVNPKFSQVTGYSIEEVIGENPNVLNSGTQTKEFYEQLWDTILAGRDWKGEFQNKKKNGELFWENVIIAPIRDEQNNISNFVAIKEDISDKKKLMSELIRAKENAEESDRLKTSFLANMSHEIRTPLNSILGFTSIMNTCENLSETERNEYSEIINKSADSLLQIINDIIDISSLETGQLKIVISRFKINKMISTIFQEFEDKVSKTKHKLQIRYLLANNDLIIESDINRLNQIFINLLTNALKFTDRGYIEFGVEKYDKQNIYFKVEDSGIGIRKELHEIIFERFRQGEDNTVRHYGGNGLGLSIVRNLIELMGGKIWVESEPGKGSRFCFYLPFKIKPA